MIRVTKSTLFRKTAQYFDADTFIVNDHGALILTKAGLGGVHAIPAGEWDSVSTALGGIKEVKKEWRI